MSFFLAILLGLVMGAISSLLLIWVSKKAKKMTPTSNFSPVTALTVGVFGSIAVLFIPSFVCVINFRKFIIPFLIAEDMTLILISFFYVVPTYIKKK